MIEVFAYWNELSASSFSRNGTLIVSGGSDTIIGNAILKNPGSARPVCYAPRSDGRYLFKPDATMYALADLFEMDKRPGTLRLFNLFDFVTTDPIFARKIALLTQDDIMGVVSHDALPTYIGWASEWKKNGQEVETQCGDIFGSILPFSPYLNPDINKNSFTHPLYLMRYGNSRPACQRLISEFRKLL